MANKKLLSAIGRTAGATALLAIVTTHPAAVSAAPPPGGPILVCETGICLLNPQGVDSDGDGYSDADEIAAGTDPRDPASHPTILQLFDGYIAGLRPEGSGFRELIVLPEMAPGGTSIESSVLGFGPQRGDAMSRLGMTDGRLGGIDMTNGFRAGFDLSKPNPATGAPKVQIGRIDPMVAGGNITSETNRELGVDVTDYEEGGEWIGFRIERDDGSIRVEIAGSDKQQSGTLGPIERAPDGSTSQTGKSTSTLPGPDGSTRTVQVESKQTTDGKGTTVTEKSYITVERDSKGNVTSQTVSNTHTTERPDGTKVQEKMVVRTQTTGNTTTTTTTTSTTTTDASGKETCTGTECHSKGYVSAEIEHGVLPGGVIVITPDLARQLEIDAGGGHTNGGDTPVEVDPEMLDEPMWSPGNPGVIYIDPSNDAVWWKPTPAMPDPDRVGGNVTPIRNVPSPLTSCVPTQQLPCVG